MPDWACAADAAETSVVPALTGTVVMRPAGTGPQPGPQAPAASSEAEPGDARQLRPAGQTATELPAADPAGDVTRTWFRDAAPGGATGTGAASPGPADPDEPDSGAPDSGAPDPGSGAAGPDRPGRPGGRRRWLMAAAAALGVFVAAMGVVTAIEAIAGKPLESVVWHKKASGTTVGGLVDGPAAQPRHSHPARSTSPSAPASPSSSPSSTAPATPTPTPTPTGSSSPAPTPSGSSPAAPSSTQPGSPGAPGASVSPGAR
jgi:hypothetical protein